MSRRYWESLGKEPTNSCWSQKRDRETLLGVIIKQTFKDEWEFTR